MRIATYNVWYENIDIRADSLIEEITHVDADIIGLQEVPYAFYERLIAAAPYPYHTFTPCDEEMGLAFLSKYPICNRFFMLKNAEYENSIAYNILLDANGIRLSVTNVHLPWDSVLAKERQAVAIDRYIHTQKDAAHFFILLGDFNCTLSSSVHHYLLGDRTLLGCESKPYWNDLASVHAALNNYPVAATLDFVNNPRWGGKNTNYMPDTCDRIYVMESFNWDYAFKLRDVRIFGKQVSPQTGYAPSDHYGLAADVDFIV